MCDLGCGDVKSEHKYDKNGICSVCGESREPATTIIYGDANGDGAVNARDALLLQQYVAGWNVTLGPI